MKTINLKKLVGAMSTPSSQYPFSPSFDITHWIEEARANGKPFRIRIKPARLSKYFSDTYNIDFYTNLKDQTPTDLYLSLHSKKIDYDLFLRRDDKDIIRHPSALADGTFASSTKGFTQNGKPEIDSSFTQLNQNKINNAFNTLRIGVKDQTVDNIKQKTEFELIVSAYPTEANPFLKTPDDPLFPQQWHLFNNQFGDNLNASSVALNVDIKAPEAWREIAERLDTSNISSGDVVIAVIDGGIDIYHEDLKNNIWVNEVELNGVNGEDDDNNGYKDDTNGWDFIADMPHHHVDNHGTHVAGIIGAEANNSTGISGVVWDTKIMPLNIFPYDPNHYGYLPQIDNQDDFDYSGAIRRAIRYAVKNEADVINMSFGLEHKFSLEDFEEFLLNPRSFQKQDRIRFKKDMKVFELAEKNDVLIVAAAGNSGSFVKDNSKWTEQGNTDKYFTSPNGFNAFFDNIISVASVDVDMRLSPYSHYGKLVDLAAPGGNGATPFAQVDPVTGEVTSVPSRYAILSTLPNNQYGESQGTSMAAPIVTGVAGLIRHINPDLTASEVKAILVDNAKNNPFIESKVKDGAMLDFQQALNAAFDSLTETI